MASESLAQSGCSAFVLHLADREAVVTDDDTVDEADVGAGTVGALVGERVLLEPEIEVGLATVEGGDGMVAAKLFDAAFGVCRAGRTHCPGSSKKPG
jgi:hypothetical protein